MSHETNKFDKKRIEIRDLFNSHINTEPSKELLNEYFIKQCDRCENYELKEDLEYSVNGDLICLSCLVDSEV
jgi:hypothetical protein